MRSFYNTHREKFHESYRKWETAARQKPWVITTLKISGKLLTALVYISYPLLLALLLLNAPEKLFRAVLVPLAIFLVTTAVRRGINAPRPYEYGDISPLVPKSTKGNSCPSRHTACAFAIALACCYANSLAGAFMLAVAAFIGISRPLMGVHYPADVLFGAFIALVTGIPGFFLIP